MMTSELSKKDCAEVLSRVALGRLGCALDDQPYVVPVYFAYDGDDIYVLSTLGQKIEWMRANPKVCVQVDEITGEAQWASVIVNGHYQELPEPQFKDERAHARKLLEKRHGWWQAAMSERQLRSGDGLIAPLFFRVRIESMTGIRSAPEAAKSGSTAKA